MKKIYLALFALASILISSCSNEEIEITSKGKLCDLTCQINVRAQYEEFDDGVFNISGTVEDILREKSEAVGITLLLYNEDGKLVEHPKSYHQFSLNNASVNFNDILEGKYTLITIQTMIYPDDEPLNKYSISGIENISTLQLDQKSSKLYLTDIVGVNISPLVLENDKNVTILPKAIGSLLHYHSYNFKNSPYISNGFGTIDMTESYKLDPSLDRNDRFYKDLSGVNYFTLRENTEFDVFEDDYQFSIYLLESSVEYEFCFKEEVDRDNATWTHYPVNEGDFYFEDGKSYYAGFQYYNENNYPDHYIGSYDGFEKWRLLAHERESEYNKPQHVIPDLYMTWGGSVKNAQSFMSGYEMLVGESGRAILQEDGSYGLEFYGDDPKTYIYYYFASETTGLFMVDVYVDNEAVSKEDLMANLKSDCVYSGTTEDGVEVFYSEDYKTIINLVEIEGWYEILYGDYNYFFPSNVRLKAPMKKELKKTRSTQKRVKVFEEKKNDNSRTYPDNFHLPFKRVSRTVFK